MSIQVIGAGFGRTGTKSLKLALEKLFGGTCLHMMEMFENRPELFPRWLAKARGEDVDLRELLDGFSATVDWPGASFYAELAELYPQAKVVLTVRDPESWYDSTRATIYDFSMRSNRPPLSWLLQSQTSRWAGPEMGDRLIWGERGHFGGRFEDKAHAISVFEAHNAEVKARIPAQRLLVYELHQGWEPLCAHLGVPVPDEPLPYLNSRREMQQQLKRIEKLAWLLSPVTAPSSLLMRRLRK